MADYAALVENHLGAAYVALNVSHEPPAVVHQRLRDAFTADADLMTAAKARRSRLTDAVTNKCYISKIKRDLLNAVLGDRN